MARALEEQIAVRLPRSLVKGLDRIARKKGAQTGLRVTRSELVRLVLERSVAMISKKDADSTATERAFAAFIMSSPAAT